jgi:hypothetical protein
MPMYDRACTFCPKEMIDCWEPISAPEVACPDCGSATARTWLQKPASVISDEIPGGLEIRHGLCNEDGSPRKYYSKSEIAAEAKRRGMVNLVEHKTDPRSGSDKNRHTTRWV